VAGLTAFGTHVTIPPQLKPSAVWAADNGVSMEFDVKKTALLARLNLKPDEAERLQKDLESILEYVKKLQALDTSEVPPTSHVLDLENVFRPDVATESGVREKALRHAPQRDGNFFKVPKVVEKE
jgi:aspartyl-tRNA(Asn)/glutamyl-tRNA(Gln) amidotransferase subunit C